MKTENRIFGNNLRVFLHRAGISVKDFSGQLGYTEYEVYKIMDARAYVSLQERHEIADFLHKSLENFYNILSNSYMGHLKQMAFFQMEMEDERFTTGCCPKNTRLYIKEETNANGCLSGCFILHIHILSVLSAFNHLTECVA